MKKLVGQARFEVAKSPDPFWCLYLMQVGRRMRYKYPRTWHFPWSGGKTNDDKVHANIYHFVGKEVVVSIKMDGECSTLYRDYYHARSIDSRNHPSRNWLRQFHSSICLNIPEGWRVCGENLYAEHSIHYKNLSSYFMAFSIWDEANKCLSWDSTVEWTNLIGIEIVPVIYRGIWDEELFKTFPKTYSAYGDNICEGFVIRIADSFHFNDFSKWIAKYVRKGHVQTDEHWMEKEIVKNELTQKK